MMRKIVVQYTCIVRLTSYLIPDRVVRGLYSFLLLQTPFVASINVFKALNNVDGLQQGLKCLEKQL